MSEKEKRIPFPCHPRDCWALPDAGASPRIYKPCAICGRVYEINTVKGTMQRMVPEDTPKRARLLLEQVTEILNEGDDVVLRRTTTGGIRVRGQHGYIKGTI